MVRITPTWVGLEAVRLKALRAAPQILASNRAMVNAVLEEVKTTVYIQTPTGPGHFGYHGRDTLKVYVTSKGLKTSGTLRAAIQLYWREYGTGARFRRTKKTKFSPGKMLLSAKESNMAGAFGGGEPAFYTAHKALGVYKRFLTKYFGGMAKWWR